MDRMLPDGGVIWVRVPMASQRDVVQLVERLVWDQEVVGSSPAISTKGYWCCMAWQSVCQTEYSGGIVTHSNHKRSISEMAIILPCHGRVDGSKPS